MSFAICAGGRRGDADGLFAGNSEHGSVLFLCPYSVGMRAPLAQGLSRHSHRNQRPRGVSRGQAPRPKLASVAVTARSRPGADAPSRDHQRPALAARITSDSAATPPSTATKTAARSRPPMRRPVPCGHRRLRRAPAATRCRRRWRKCPARMAKTRPASIARASGVALRYGIGPQPRLPRRRETARPRRRSTGCAAPDRPDSSRAGPA